MNPVAVAIILIFIFTFGLLRIVYPYRNQEAQENKIHKEAEKQQELYAKNNTELSKKSTEKEVKNTFAIVVIIISSILIFIILFLNQP